MIITTLFNKSSMTELDFEVTNYVNNNLKCIIRVLIDYLEDDNGFTIDYFLPYNDFDIDNGTWIEMVYTLYSIICSDLIRDYVKPKYNYLLYIILQWWEDCNDNLEDMIPIKLDEALLTKIQTTYISENGNNNILELITNFEEYYYICFEDHDFLPQNLERLVTIYLRDPDFFELKFGDIDLKEFWELIPKDLKEQFDDRYSHQKELIIKSISNQNLLRDLIFCCERLQSNNLYYDLPENRMNDYIRDLLTAMKYEGLRDQTRQGTSLKGKEAGEVDILIKKDNFPFSVIEALKLSYLNKNYISEHIDKIYKYDTLGHECNYIISYVKSKDFSTFWENYILYIKDYKYPFNLINCIEDLNIIHCSEIKCAISELNRNNNITKLYHIVVHIPD